MRRSCRTFAVLLLAIVAAACGSTNPTSTPGTATAHPTAPPTARPTLAPSAQASADRAVYAQIEADIEQLRDLRASKSLVPTILDESAVADYMTKAFDRDTNPATIAATETILKHLGLLQPSASLRKLEIDLEASQVIGFYDSATKQLYLVSSSGKVGPVEKVTFAHEFTHALQDQNFGLDKLATDTPDQSDGDLARLSLPEGDATLAMTAWAQAKLSVPELLQLAGASAGASQQQLDAAPTILREQLLFPYTQGLSFVRGIYNAGGWAAVDRLYANPPSSTSQILHPELYTQGVQPVAVTLPPVPQALAGWKLSNLDTLGEFQLGVWLAGDGASRTALTAGAKTVAGWAGDRLGLYEGPNGGWAVVLRTAWRNADAAAAFQAAAANGHHADGAVLDLCSVNGQVEVVIGSDATAADAFGCGGD